MSTPGDVCRRIADEGIERYVARRLEAVEARLSCPRCSGLMIPMLDSQARECSRGCGYHDLGRVRVSPPFDLT